MMASRSIRSASAPTSSSAIRPASSWSWRPYEGYWRKVPSVKRLVFKSVPEATTRLAMLKRGEVDVAYLPGVPAGRGGEAGPDAEAGLLRGHRLVLPRFPRSVGPQVALARPARAAGRQLCHRPPGAQRGGDARGLQAHGEHHSAHLRVRAAHRTLSLRSRRRRSSCWPRPAIPTASTPGSCTRFRPTSRWARRSSAIWRRSGSR